MGLSSTLSVAARSLEIFSAGIQVAGNNVSNAGTPGYIRESLKLTTSGTSQVGGLTFGSGVEANGVRQDLDRYLEQRIYVANSDAAGAETRKSVFQQLESALQELGTSDLSTQLTRFVSGLEELSSQPESAQLRLLAITGGKDLAAAIQNLRVRVDEQRTSLNSSVSDYVIEANKLIDSIASLNRKIVAIESSGLQSSDAGGLRSQRLEALNRLSEIVSIKAIEQPNGFVDIFLGSENLVIESKVQHLETRAVIDRGVVVTQVQIKGANFQVPGTGGELLGTISGRDDILGQFVDELDTLTRNVAFEFNKIFSSGQGIHGYDNVTGTNSVSSAASPLSAAGLTYPPKNGSFQILVTNTGTGLTTTHDITVDLDGIGADTSLASLASQIDGLGNISASVTGELKLNIAAASGYEIRFADDSSHVLASLGINTFFTGTNSANIAVNSVITGDPLKFASGRGGGPGDGTNATALAQFAQTGIKGAGGLSLFESYQQLVSSVAQASSTESGRSRSATAFRDSLLSQKSQISGVSIDEELVNILRLEQLYAAGGRMIKTVNDLFQILINI